MIFQNEKTPFQAIKSRNSKSRKIDIFPKGLSHGFRPKMSIFPNFFLANIGLENVFCDTLERKNAFLRHKNKKFKKSKNSHFSKGLLVQKWPFFQLFFFQAKLTRKMSFMTFQNEIMPFQAIKTRSSKRRKIGIFPKGLIHAFGPKKAIFLNFFFQAIYSGKLFFMIFQNEKTPF